MIQILIFGFYDELVERGSILASVSFRDLSRGSGLSMKWCRVRQPEVATLNSQKLGFSVRLGVF